MSPPWLAAAVSYSRIERSAFDGGGAAPGACIVGLPWLAAEGVGAAPGACIVGLPWLAAEGVGAAPGACIVGLPWLAAEGVGAAPGEGVVGDAASAAGPVGSGRGGCAATWTDGAGFSAPGVVRGACAATFGIGVMPPSPLGWMLAAGLGAADCTGTGAAWGRCAASSMILISNRFSPATDHRLTSR
jgi:hypothetical protein